jgi:5-methylcytosine-specific restriction endonuclease McrA
MRMKRKTKTSEERRVAQCAATARWLAKPGNQEKHRAAVKRCRQRPEAKERHRVRQLAYAERNREQEKRRVARWRKEKPEKAVETHRIYYLKNQSKVRAATRAYRNANLEAYKEYGRQYRSARRAGGGRLSKGYIARLMATQNSACPACRSDLRISGHHIDHIVPISKGGLHCDANVQLLCPPCNRRKSAKNFDDFLAELQRAAA